MMKKLSFVAAVLSAMVFNSCRDSEPIDPALLATKDAIGIYKMVSFLSSVPVDIDGNNISNDEVTKETDCYNDNTLTLSGNGTFKMTMAGAEIVNSEGSPSIACVTNDNITGTWRLQDNIVTLTYKIEEEDFVDALRRVEGKLVYEIENVNVANRAPGGTPVNIQADVTITYAK